MLQTLLQNLLPGLQNTTAVAIPLAVLLAFVARRPGRLTRGLWGSIALGMAGALAIATMRLTSVLGNREVIDGVVLAGAIVTETLMLVYFWRAHKDGFPDDGANIPGWAVWCVPAAMILAKGLDFFLFAGRLVMPASQVVWPGYAMQPGGFVVGILLGISAGLAVFRVASMLPVRELLFGATAVFGAVMAQQAVIVIQVLLARGVLPMKKWLLALMVPLINNQVWFFGVLLAATLALPAYLFLGRRPAPAQGLNPAQCRKLAAAARRQIRWGTVAVASVALVFCLATVGKAYADQKPVLSPAVPVVAQKGEITISLDTVADGKLHRYSYTASGGTVMRFIIIKKGGSAYGVGLDACDICGPTGYYERDGQVVCKLCDVVMNKATIGFKGGCNPVPFPYKITDGKIVIAAEALEKEKKRFR
jgi:uncharacterized membrane protein